MMAGRMTSLKGLRIDDGVTGADMKRPGFLSLIRDATADRSISHLFIYRRDRFARPQDALEMAKVEKDLRRAGLTIVFADEVAGPLDPGEENIVADLGMWFAYHESGQFIPKHAERIIQAQRQLAQGGYRTGGNAPYGFGRALVDAAGTVVQELPAGMTARQPGCHVRLVPKDLRQDRRLARDPGAAGAGLGLQAGRPAPQRGSASRAPAPARSAPIRA